MAKYTFTKDFHGYTDGADFPSYHKKVGDVVTGEPAPLSYGGGRNILVNITANDKTQGKQTTIAVPLEFFQKQYTFTKDFSSLVGKLKKDFKAGESITGEEMSVNGKKVLRLTMMPPYGNLDIPMEYFGEASETEGFKSNTILIYAAVAIGSILIYKYFIK
jgi:hypothetical protein